MGHGKARIRRCPAIGLLVVLFLGSIQSVSAQVESGERADFEPIHWAYSSFFGTGWYQIKDARSVFVLRIPPRQTLRSSFISEAGDRHVGIEIHYPLTVGLHDIKDLGGIVENDNFGTASFTPGVEIEYPVNQHWYLRSFANVGWGRELDSDDSAWIYFAGVKSRYTVEAEKLEWSLLAGLYYAGYSPDRGRSDYLAVAQLGAEIRQPLSKARWYGKPVDIHWNLMYSFMGHALHFNQPDGRYDPIEDTIEFGLQMSFRDGPYKIGFMNIHRLGVGYRISSSGRFSAITLSMRSWFTR